MSHFQSYLGPGTSWLFSYPQGEQMSADWAVSMKYSPAEEPSKDGFWMRFLISGDEWLCAYACLPLHLSSVQPFAIAHAVELYLKAAYAKNNGSVRKAAGKGHNLKAIWDDLKKDPAFMREYEILDSIYKLPTPIVVSGRLPTDVSRQDQGKYQAHKELYVVMHLVKDLKYIGSPLAAAKGAPIGFHFVFPDNYWLDFFRDLRGYLKYPEGNHFDYLADALKHDDIPERARRYLSKLYQQI